MSRLQYLVLLKKRTRVIRYLAVRSPSSSPILPCAFAHSYRNLHCSCTRYVYMELLGTAPFKWLRICFLGNIKYKTPKPLFLVKVLKYSQYYKYSSTTSFSVPSDRKLSPLPDFDPQVTGRDKLPYLYISY